MKIIILSLLVLINANLFANSGDTTTVLVHQNQDLHWQGSSYGGTYIEMANFPDASQKFQDIKMSFSIGCNNAGVCSHWDYDLDIWVGEYSGTYDSTIASFDTLSYQALELDTLSTNPLVLDTISTNPLVLDTLQDYIFLADTNWSVFEVIIWHEMGRMITPYGTYMDDASMYDGWDNTWWHTYTYDVTDFRPFLQGQTPVKIQYHGWQDGWRVSTKFDFVEGQPTRDVLNVENVYKGGDYTSFNQFDASFTPSKTVLLDDDVDGVKLKITVTGHGQYGEFTPVNYKVKSGNTVIREEAIWRDDCGMLPISPQGGTWIFNRANWCPGDAVEIHEFELSDFIQGSGASKKIKFNIDFDNFTPTDAAYYSLTAQLITYKSFRRDFDVVLDAVIAPSSNENFVRMNSICAYPIVRIKNNGREVLTSAQIKYWVSATNYRYFYWTGSLKYGETEDVTLTPMDWNGVDFTNPKFYAEVSWPNGVIDQFPTNNTKIESFEFPDVYNSGNLKIRFRANNHPNENSFTLKSGDGALIASENTFNAQAINDFAYNLDDGCYIFEFYDVDDYWGLDGGGDGISWWLNTNNSLESSGYLRLLNGANNSTLKTFRADFGSKIFYSFTVGDALNNLESLPIHTEPSHPEVDTVIIDGEEFYVLDGTYYGENEVISNVNDLDGSVELLKMFPNPANDFVSLYIETDNTQKINIIITNIIGEVLDQFIMKTNKVKKYKIGDIANGIYIVKFSIDGISSTRKLIIEK